MNSQESNLHRQDPAAGQTPTPQDADQQTPSTEQAPTPKTPEPDASPPPAPETPVAATEDAPAAVVEPPPAPETPEPDARYAVGSRVWGQVLRLTDKQAVVALGEHGLEEGSLDLIHLRDEFGNLHLNEGDEVQAYVVANAPAITLAPSLLPPSAETLGKLKEAQEKKEIVRARVVGLNRGGMELDIEGLRGFCPYSHIEIGRCEKPEIYLNHILDFKISELDEEKKRVVLSRRVILEEERKEKMHELRAQIKDGAEFEGVVMRLQPFGAFVDIGGIEGLVHVSEIAFDRVNDPGEVLRRGEKVRVKVLGTAPGKDGKERIRLSIKALQQDPWTIIDQLFKRNDIITGRVTRVTDFGAFVKLHPGIEGLLHVSEYKPRDAGAAPEAAPAPAPAPAPEATPAPEAASAPEATPAPEVATEAPAEEKPAEQPAEQPAGETPAAEAPVTPAAETPAAEATPAPAEEAKQDGIPVEGNEILVRISRIDRDRHRVSLSLHSESEDEGKQHDASVGEVHTGVVRTIKPYGVFVDLPTVGPWVSGLLPVSETGLDRGANLKKEFAEGQEVKVEIIEIDDRGRFRLSQRSLINRADGGGAGGAGKGGVSTAPPGGFNTLAEALEKAQDRQNSK